MKISYKAFLNKIKQVENQQLPLVAFRFPNCEQVHLFYQNDVELYPTSWEDTGFVMHSFTGDKSFLLRGENYFYSQVISEGINSGTSQEIEIKINKTHLSLVEKAVRAIQDSDFQKVVLSQKISVETSVKSLSVYFERLINTYSSAFCYVFSHPKIGKWIAATPEILVKMDKNQLETMSLAGTQKVSQEPFPNWHEKEKEEQQIVTDTIVNALIPLVENLSVGETKNLQAGNLWHLYTPILAELSSKNIVYKIVNSLHPTPAVCGFPTEKARSFILANENYNREFYTGFCGLVNFPKEEIRLFVNLRCMQLFEDTAFVYVGSGITKDSSPETEQKEIENKAQTMLKILFS